MTPQTFTWDVCTVLRAPCAIASWPVVDAVPSEGCVVCVVAWIDDQWVCARLVNPLVEPSEYWKQIRQYPADSRWRPSSVLGYVAVNLVTQERTAVTWRLLVEEHGRLVPGPVVGQDASVLEALPVLVFRSESDPPIPPADPVPAPTGPPNPVVDLLQQIVTLLTPKPVSWWSRWWWWWWGAL